MLIEPSSDKQLAAAHQRNLESVTHEDRAELARNALRLARAVPGLSTDGALIVLGAIGRLLKDNDAAPVACGGARYDAWRAWRARHK